MTLPNEANFIQHHLRICRQYHEYIAIQVRFQLLQTHLPHKPSSIDTAASEAHFIRYFIINLLLS